MDSFPLEVCARCVVQVKSWRDGQLTDCVLLLKLDLPISCVLKDMGRFRRVG